MKKALKYEININPVLKKKCYTTKYGSKSLNTALFGVMPDQN